MEGGGNLDLQKPKEFIAFLTSRRQGLWEAHLGSIWGPSAPHPGLHPPHMCNVFALFQGAPEPRRSHNNIGARGGAQAPRRKRDRFLPPARPRVSATGPVSGKSVRPSQQANSSHHTPNRGSQKARKREIHQISPIMVKFTNNCEISPKTHFLRKMAPETYAKRCATATFSAWGGKW